MKKTAYLSLGSNLGNRVEILEFAVRRLATLGSIHARSLLYETEPVEMKQQPWFLNLALALETELIPQDLLRRILAVEQEMGRHRIQPKGPRTVDIDILFIDDLIVDTPALTIPHPAMHERRFVLVPLADIAPEVRHPVLKKTVRELLEDFRMGAAVVRQIEGTRAVEI